MRQHAWISERTAKGGSGPYKKKPHQWNHTPRCFACDLCLDSQRVTMHYLLNRVEDAYLCKRKNSTYSLCRWSHWLICCETHCCPSLQITVNIFHMYNCIERAKMSSFTLVRVQHSHHMTTSFRSDASALFVSGSPATIPMTGLKWYMYIEK